MEMWDLKKKHNLNIVQKGTWPADLRPNPSQLATVTDTYFLRTKNIVSSYGDTEVTYAIFMRRPVLYALNTAIDWLKSILNKRKCKININ